MTDEPASDRPEIDRLVSELEKAEAYELRLRQFIVDIRAEMVAGRIATAMSLANAALNYIDDATDVVASHRTDEGNPRTAR